MRRRPSFIARRQTPGILVAWSPSVILYANGRGVEKDDAKAAELYRKAADAGNSRGLVALGILYANGRGVEKDDAKAAELYRKAADAGNSDGMVNLGILYVSGRGVEQDDAKAAELYRKAADAGHSVGMFNLGILYEKRLGVEKDDAKAAELYRKAADAGYSDALVYSAPCMRAGAASPKAMKKPRISITWPSIKATSAQRSLYPCSIKTCLRFEKLP